jgi:hypothetical protein
MFPGFGSTPALYNFRQVLRSDVNRCTVNKPNSSGARWMTTNFFAGFLSCGQNVPGKRLEFRATCEHHQAIPDMAVREIVLPANSAAPTTRTRAPAARIADRDCSTGRLALLVSNNVQ